MHTIMAWVERVMIDYDSHAMIMGMHTMGPDVDYLNPIGPFFMIG